MERFLSARAMNFADEQTIQRIGIPAFTLMESAGREAARICLSTLSAEGKAVLILCGKGNNGGDGYAMARHLASHCAATHVVHISAREQMSETARGHFDAMIALSESMASLQVSHDTKVEFSQTYDIIVDALLGTGTNSALRPPVSHVVEWANAQSSTRVALDIPTGLHPDTGACLGQCFQADVTISMAAAKVGLVVGDGPEYSGTIHVADIGIPSAIIDTAMSVGGCARALSVNDISNLLPTRSRQAHKYSAGMSVVVGGSPGLTGAPVIAATAAARIGAGAVTCACPSSIQPLLAEKLTEVMTVALPEVNGEIDTRNALAALEPTLAKSKSLLVGCGIGRLQSTQKFVVDLLSHTNLPTVIDADGLIALGNNSKLLDTQRETDWVLTPHAGELKHLLGDGPSLDRVSQTCELAAKWDCVLVNKGNPSLVAARDGTTYVNLTGSSALATAGSGDFLAGCIAGLMAQGLTGLDAAVVALFVGGIIADDYSLDAASTSLMAMDLVQNLPFALKQLQVNA